MNPTNNRKLIAAAVMGLAFALAGCAGSPTTKSTGNVIDDSVIATKVKTKMIEDPVVKALDIQVETFKGTVQLSGFAASQDQIDRAVVIARNTAGVKSVRNDIRLK
jgi:osmotically-inducible protein OsmY